MLRKVITIIVAIVALILLFLLIRAAVGAFTGDPEPEVGVQTEGTISDPIDIDIPGDNDAPATQGQTTPSTNGNTSGNATAPGTPSTTTGKTPEATNQELAKSGAAETAMVTIAATTAMGTMLYVRRRQLANL